MKALKGRAVIGKGAIIFCVIHPLGPSHGFTGPGRWT